MAAFITVAGSFGLGAAAGGLILSGIAIFMLARFLPKLQLLFPPEVTGVLLVILGFSLIEGGIRRSTGLQNGVIDSTHVLIALSTLSVIVGCSIWAPRNIKIFAVVLGTITGLGVSVLNGEFGTSQLVAVSSEPFFAFPLTNYEIPTPKFIVAAVIPIFIIELIGAVDSIGSGVAIDRINNAKWKRTDMNMISRLVSCHGIGVLLSGVMGTLSVGTSSANLGLTHATGVAARSVAVMAGLILMIVAFLPQVSVFITQIPTPVVGAIILYTAGYILTAGMELILSRLLNNRRMFLVGISISMGAAILLVPELTTQVPEELKPVFQSALAVGVITAITLNLLFRIGIVESGEISLPGPHSSKLVTDFLEDKGASWGARRDVILRAGIAVCEALEALQSADLIQGDIRVSARFDEYKLIIDIIYEGQAISFEAEKPIDLHAVLLEEDGDNLLEAAINNMSGVLIINLADFVESFQSENQARLRLIFNH
jgi:xanthine/uracil permease